jgi:hypothetical protein
VSAATKDQPKFTAAVPANPGWWAKIAVVANTKGWDKGPKFIYEPVSSWLLYYDEVLGVFIDAPQTVAEGGKIGGHGRLSEIEGFAGFVYEPARTETGWSAS